MTPEEKRDNFKTELLNLLNKYKAEIILENFASGYSSQERIVVSFDFDESLFKEHNTGITPYLILGSYFG